MLSQGSARVIGGVRGTRPWRLGARTRKAVLVVHIVSVGAWIGTDVVMAVLIGTAVFSDDPQVQALSYQALELFVVWSLLIAGLLCLASGVVLGLGSKYGLVRYWWVVSKLALNLMLTGLVLISLRGEITAKAEKGRQLAAGELDTIALDQLIYPPIVSPAALVIAVILAVFKPWGRIRKRSTT